MNNDEMDNWITNYEKKDLLHTYCTDIKLIRKVITKQITTPQYQKQLIVNIQTDIDKLQITIKENQDMAQIIKDKSKQASFQQNIQICQTKIAQLEAEIKVIQNI